MYLGQSIKIFRRLNFSTTVSKLKESNVLKEKESTIKKKFQTEECVPCVTEPGAWKKRPDLEAEGESVKTNEWQKEASKPRVKEHDPWNKASIIARKEAEKMRKLQDCEPNGKDSEGDSLKKKKQQKDKDAEEPGSWNKEPKDAKGRESAKKNKWQNDEPTKKVGCGEKESKIARGEDCLKIRKRPSEEGEPCTYQTCGGKADSEIDARGKRMKKKKWETEECVPCVTEPGGWKKIPPPPSPPPPDPKLLLPKSRYPEDLF